MSTHSFDLPRPPNQDVLVRIQDECTAVGRPTQLMQVNGATIVLWFSPDLSANEISALGDIIRAVKTDLNRAERNAIQSDIDLLVTFQGIATPTLAQTAAATKAQSRILRALLRS